MWGAVIEEKKTNFSTLIKLVAPVILFVVPLLVLLGWQFDNETLKSLVPGYVAMNPFTALCFMAVSLALWRATKPGLYNTAIIILVGFILAVIGLVVYGSLSADVGLALDHILFSEKLGTNQMAPNTAISFVLVGVGLMLLRVSKMWVVWAVRSAAMLLMSVAGVAILGYILDLRPLYGVADFIPMALHTAMLFLVVGVVIFMHTLHNKLPLDKPIVTIFIVLIVTLIGTINVASVTFRELRTIQQKVLTNNKVLSQVEELISQVKDAESAQRGYELTRDEVYLKPYYKSLANYDKPLSSLQTLLEGNPEQLARMDKLGGLISQKFEFIAMVVKFEMEGNTAAAVASVRTNRGNDLMSEIRAVGAEIKTTATSGLEQELAQQQGANNRSLSTILLGTLTGVLMIGTVIVLLIRENRLRNVAEDHLRLEKNAAVAAQVKDEAILSSIGDGVFALNPRGKIILFNKAAHKITGFTAEEAMNRPYQEILQFRSKDGEHKQDDFIHNALKGKVSNMADSTTVIHKNGHPVAVADSAAPVYDPHKKLIGIIVVFRDVTQELQTEAAMRESNERFEKVAEATSDAIYDLNAKTGEIWWGKGVEFGYTLTHAGRNLEWWMNHIHPDDAKRITNEMTAIYEGNASHWSREYRFLKANGKYAYVRDRAIIQRNDKGKVIRVIGSIMDITQQKELNLAKDEFLSLASHQLRTPLTAIRLFSEMLVDGQVGKLNKQQHEYAEKIEQSTERMVRLIGDILNISRVQLGRLKIEPKPLHIEDIVERSVEEIRPVAKQKGLTLTYKKSTLAPTQIDVVLMEQIIHNLLTNAVRYTHKGGVEVALDQDGNGYLLSVKDTGIGIPKESENRIFERFYRADNAVKVEGEGTGLGLYLIKMVMRTTGGQVWFKTREGKGTTFFVKIPLRGMQEHEGDRGLR